MKRILCLLTLVTLLFTAVCANAQVTPNSAADQLFQGGIQTLAIRESGVSAIVFAAGQQLSPKDCTIYVDGQEIKIQDVRSLESDGIRTTWVILFDAGVSGATATAQTLLDYIPENDLFTAISVGTDITAATFSTGKDRDVLKNGLDKLKNVAGGDRNTTARDVLGYLATSSTTERTCLVIVSQGKQATAEVQNSELANMAGASRTTVYTVDLQCADDKNAADKDRVAAYGSVARTSKGGDAIRILSKWKNGTAADIAKSIFDNEARFCSVVLEPNSVKSGRKLEFYLASGVTKASLELTLVEEDKLKQFAANPPTPTPAPIETDTPVPTDPPVPGSLWEKIVNWVQENQTIAIGAGAALLVLIVVLIVCLARKKPPVEVKQGPEVSEPVSYSGPAEPQPPEKPQPTAPLLTLEDVETKQVYSHELNAQLLVGRVESKVDLPIKNNDNGISAIHCSFSLREGVLYVKDFNSTNGTYINNVKIDKPAILHQGDVLRLGKTKLRVNW